MVSTSRRNRKQNAASVRRSANLCPLAFGEKGVFYWPFVPQVCLFVSTNKLHISMLAIKIPSPAHLDRLEPVDIPAPGAPGPSEIRVRLRASSLNSHDLSVANGKIPVADGRIPMSDGAGIVEAIGDGVTEFSVGDSVVSCFFPFWLDGPPTVAGFGKTPGDGLDGYAREQVVTPATWFTAAPKGWSHAEAATLTTAGLTAWRALVSNGQLKSGDTVLVLGTGGVSIYALQIAKALGARVAVTSSSDEKLERARSLGADYLVNYRQHADWGARVAEWTGGTGVDHVIEVGGPATLAQSIKACRVGGHIAVIGVLTGIAGELPVISVIFKQIRLQGLVVGNRREQIEFVKHLETIGIRPIIDRTFPLKQLSDAFRHEKAGYHFGKICIEI
jgi:NADPH:quinone reductase-like Zn-dependent oxidoreductase